MTDEGPHEVVAFSSDGFTHVSYALTLAAVLDLIKFLRNKHSPVVFSSPVVYMYTSHSFYFYEKN